MMDENLRKRLRKKRKTIRVLFICIGITLLISVGLVLGGFITNNRTAQVVLYSLAGAFLAATIAILFVYFKLTKSGWNSDYLMLIRLEKYYYLVDDFKPERKPVPDFQLFPAEHLQVYEKAELDGGTLYYLLGLTNPLNRSKTLVNAFFVLDNVTHQSDIERGRLDIRKYSERVISYLKERFEGNNFLNCAICCFHENLEERDIVFYHNFPGYRVFNRMNAARFGTSSGSTISHNMQFNYVGFNKETEGVIYYLELPHDTGDEVDLEGLILAEIFGEKEELPPFEENVFTSDDVEDGTEDMGEIENNSETESVESGGVESTGDTISTKSDGGETENIEEAKSLKEEEND